MATLWHLIKVFFNQPSIKLAFKYVIGGWFIWLPALAVYLFWQSWLNYIHLRFIKNLSWTLLEIKIPREITKSPKAMEVILSAFHNTRNGNLVERFWEGFLRIWYSLEIVSLGGQVHFLIRVQKFVRNFVEAQIYAQYPGAEIVEIDDYTDIISFHDLKGEWNLWGAEFSFTKEDAYPIRTYIDFGLEAGKTKEEEKTDPLTSFLESLGSLNADEQIWFQVLIRPADSGWKKRAEAVIEELQQKKGAVTADENILSSMLLTPGQREVLMAVEHNVAKLGYETGIRAIYLAKKEVFSSTRKSILASAMRQYSTQNMNSFKPATTSVDYFFVKWREALNKKRILCAYQQRSYFYIPFRSKPFVMNTEGLATIFHFPGRVAETPTLGRIEAKRSEPPINLPI